MERNIIFFDLDGTLTDPMLGITRSVQHALKAYDIIEEDLTRLIPFIGPPLKDSFMKFYDFSAKKMNGQEVKMEEFKGKVVLIVNTASKCGLTPQFTELEELNKKYKEEGLEILGFPCNQFANQDKGSNEEIQEFCSLNYGVTFNMFQKIEVNGENAHPLYKFLKNEKKGLLSKEIKWNFTKFLVDSEGNVVKRYAPTVKPLKIEEDIKKLLK